MLKDLFPEVITINGDGSWWWTKCMNQGFKKAKEIGSDFVLILNDDNEVEKDYLKILLSDYNTLPHPSILGSISISIEKPHYIESAGTKSFNKLTLKCNPYLNSKRKLTSEIKGVHHSFTLSGRGTLIPIELFDRIGFYDESFVQYMSDDDFCLTAIDNNLGVYISWNCHVYTHSKLTSKGNIYNDSIFTVLRSFFNKYSVNSLYKYYLAYRKHGIPLLAPLYILYTFLGTIYAFYKHKLNKLH